jgi:hypothetical protein
MSRCIALLLNILRVELEFEPVTTLIDGQAPPWLQTLTNIQYRHTKAKEKVIIKLEWVPLIGITG